MAEVLMGTTPEVLDEVRASFDAIEDDGFIATLAPAIAGKRQRLLSLECSVHDVTSYVSVADSSPGGFFMGEMEYTAAGRFDLPYNPLGWVETLPGGTLEVVSGEARVSGCAVLVYV